MDNVANFAFSTIKVAPSPAISGTTVSVDDPSSFVTPPFRAFRFPRGQQPSLSNAEVVRVTSGSGTNGDPYVIVREYEESGGAKAWASGDMFVAGVTAGLLEYLNTLILTHNHSGSQGEAALGVTSMVTESPTGAINGSNTVYTTSVPFSAGSLKVYVNGIREYSAIGYNEAAGANGFTMTYAPQTGDTIRVDFVTQPSIFATGSTSFINNETPSGTPNGATTLFTTAFGYVPGSTVVIKNGITLDRTDDYGETSPTLGFITMSVAPLTGDKIRVYYQKSVSVAGNADTLDGYHASPTPTANQIPVIDANGNLNFGLVGEIKPYMGSVSPSGWLFLNGATIGSASSGATGRANDDTFNLYSLLWTSTTNTELVIQTSAGAGSTRGASAAADFAANKRLPIPSAAGRALVGLNASDTEFNALGKTFGAKTHTLTTAELASHRHTLTALNISNPSAAFTINDNSGDYIAAADLAAPGLNAGLAVDKGSDMGLTGSGNAHNNIQPSLTVNYIIKY